MVINLSHITRVMLQSSKERTNHPYRTCLGYMYPSRSARDRDSCSPHPLVQPLASFTAEPITNFRKNAVGPAQRSQYQLRNLRKVRILFPGLRRKARLKNHVGEVNFQRFQPRLLVGAQSFRDCQHMLEFTASPIASRLLFIMLTHYSREGQASQMRKLL